MTNGQPVGSNNVLTYAQVASLIPTTQPLVSNISTPSLDNNFRMAVLTAVHSEMQLKHKRSNNIVVSGLAISKMASDADQFRELCESELNAYPRARSAVRLGAPIVGRIQPLLVCLESPEDVEKIMLVARDLRNSSNWFVRNRIFINRHLTKAEAAAAFHAREQRRLKERSTANDPNPSSDMSTTGDAATSLNSVSNRSIDDVPSCSIVIPPPPPPPYHQPPAPSVSSNGNGGNHLNDGRQPDTSSSQPQ